MLLYVFCIVQFQKVNIPVESLVFIQNLLQYILNYEFRGYSSNIPNGSGFLSACFVQTLKSG